MLNIRKAKVWSALLPCFLIPVLGSLPVRADTSSELKAARDRLASLQANLDKLASQYAAAESKPGGTGAQM